MKFSMTRPVKIVMLGAGGTGGIVVHENRFLPERELTAGGGEARVGIVKRAHERR